MTEWSHPSPHSSEESLCSTPPSKELCASTYVRACFPVGSNTPLHLCMLSLYLSLSSPPAHIISGVCRTSMPLNQQKSCTAQHMEPNDMTTLSHACPSGRLKVSVRGPSSVLRSALLWHIMRMWVLFNYIRVCYCLMSCREKCEPRCESKGKEEKTLLILLTSGRLSNAATKRRNEKKKKNPAWSVCFHNADCNQIVVLSLTITFFYNKASDEDTAILFIFLQK